MKYLLLLILVSCGCYDETSKEKAEIEKKSCDKTQLTHVATVNGCKVYDVEADYWHAYSGCGDSPSYCVKAGRRFMYTDCSGDSVKWRCGKHCQQTNPTK